MVQSTKMFDQPLFGQLLAAIGSRWRPSPAVGGRSSSSTMFDQPFVAIASRWWQKLLARFWPRSVWHASFAKNGGGNSRRPCWQPCDDRRRHRQMRHRRGGAGSHVTTALSVRNSRLMRFRFDGNHSGDCSTCLVMNAMQCVCVTHRPAKACCRRDCQS